MNEYPEELTTIPAPVVGLMGCSSLHSQLARSLAMSAPTSSTTPVTSAFHLFSGSAPKDTNSFGASTTAQSLPAPNSTTPLNTSSGGTNYIVPGGNFSGLRVISYDMKNYLNPSSPAAPIHFSSLMGISRAAVLNTMPVILQREKSKRISYENYTPQGILKGNWLFKHTYLLPSVVALFFNWTNTQSNPSIVSSSSNPSLTGSLSSSSSGSLSSLSSSPLASNPSSSLSSGQGNSAKDSTMVGGLSGSAVTAASTTYGTGSFESWKQKENEIANVVDTVKAALRGRNIKYILVLVHTNQSEPPNDERLLNLRKRLEIDSKNVLFYNKDDGKTSVKRLEDKLKDVSSSWYREEARRIKKERDKLNKLTQGSLYVRLCFKIAIYAEFRKDFRSALKYHTTAYNCLKDFVKDNSKLPEVKVVSEYINYKICKIYMAENLLTEAVKQFELHVRFYKKFIGFVEREFEHWAWISRQYRVFGQVLDGFFPAHLSSSSLQQQTSGFYYQTAASYASQRKRIAHVLCETARQSPQFDLYKKVQPTSWAGLDLPRQQYVGQPLLTGLDTWAAHPLELAGGSSNETNEEVDRVLYSASGELKVEHSRMILELLEEAYQHYKQSERSNRMVLYLSYQMAEEFMAAKNWASAKKYFDSISSAYYDGQWWTLLRVIFKKSHEAALKLSLIQSYIQLSLYLLSPNLKINIGEKKEIIHGLITAITKPSTLNFAPLESPWEQLIGPDLIPDL